MPTYEYECTACNGAFEIFHGMTDPAPAACPGCGTEGTLRKLLSAGSGLIFKGSGFYITDYKKNGSESKSAESSGGESKTSETKGSETKGDKTKKESPKPKTEKTA